MGRRVLFRSGYQVITVNNGSAALKKIAEVKPDLIVLDVYMPGYSGLEVCQRLKENQETARTPVLLTVGKLEPFKPEEAKRVRAEGFIVKPFEASELLSALSKLEDKIVPRAEHSKPGRFARAIAAVEESGRSGSTGAPDEDSGWKNRIAFPSKKKKKSEEEDGDDPAIYNAVNRDLRTVVEHGPARKENDEETSAGDRVDIAALGAPGVPRDVSAEEVAAIAAAAAQVQASSEAGQSEETNRSVRSEGAAEGQDAGNFEEAALKPPEREKDVEVQAGTPAEAVAAENRGSAAEAAARATFAEIGNERIETRKEEDDSGVRRGDQSDITGTAPANAEVITAVALEPNNGNSWNADSAASGAEHSTEETPMTMAVGSSPTRWMAIPVAIDPEEAAISLELEMQKAYAAFAAAEANSPGFLNSTPQDSVVSVPSAVVEQALVSPTSEPEIAQSVNAVADASVEALRGAVTELAEVAASHAPDEALVEREQDAAAFHQETISGPEVSEVAEVASRQDLATPPVQAQEPGYGAEQAVPFVAEGTEEPGMRETHRPETDREEPIVEEASASRGESAAGGMRDMAEKTESDLAA